MWSPFKINKWHNLAFYPLRSNYPSAVGAAESHVVIWDKEEEWKDKQMTHFNEFASDERNL